jgi:hypothetical protein
MSNLQPYANDNPTPSYSLEMKNFVQVMRMFMRDHSELNRLIAGEENSDRLIVWAIIDAVEDFNETPPPISVAFREIPKHILKYGVALNLLDSLLFLSTRNALAYSDGGINVNLDKTNQLLQHRQLMEASYEQKKARWKVAKNIQQGYGSIQSEYWHLSGFYGAW